MKSIFILLSLICVAFSARIQYVFWTGSSVSSVPTCVSPSDPVGSTQFDTTLSCQNTYVLFQHVNLTASIDSATNDITTFLWDNGTCNGVALVNVTGPSGRCIVFPGEPIAFIATLVSIPTTTTLSTSTYTSTHNSTTLTSSTILTSSTTSKTGSTSSTSSSTLTTLTSSGKSTSFPLSISNALTSTTVISSGPVLVPMTFMTFGVLLAFIIAIFLH